jgi:hypothetical protein
MPKLAIVVLSAWLAAGGLPIAARQEALTCRFNYEQSITRPDVNAPVAKSGLLVSPEIYTISFDVIGNAGRYTREMQHLGTTAGEVTVLRGENRVSFYENVSGDNLFFLTVFTGISLDDGGHPAVISSHVWLPEIKNKLGEALFLPSQSFGSCR